MDDVSGRTNLSRREKRKEERGPMRGEVSSPN
jgi:hypothetical protein